MSRTLTLAELSATVEYYASEVRTGKHSVELGYGERWHTRIYQDADVDVWLISWTTEQGTELHDHGGSSGAFTVVDGSITEYVWSGAKQDEPGSLVDHLRGKNRTVVYGPHYVHDMRNHADAPAVTVHAYSPPLRKMNYYDVAEDSLLHWAANWTDDPEAPSPERTASV